MKIYGSLGDEEASVGMEDAPVIDSPTPLTRASSRSNKPPHEVFGHTSQFWVDADSAFAGIHTLELRLDFIKKVYSILSAQLLVTVLMCTVFMSVDSVRIWAIQNAGALLFASIIPTFGCLFALMCYKDQYPWNYYLLTVFTFAESLSLGLICSVYAESGAGIVILQAFVITFGVFFAMTLFALQSKTDFTPYTGILLVVLVSMLIVSIFAGLFGFSMGILYSWLGALLFCGFIVVDTQMIMKRMGYDDYIIASIELYLDILNLFLFILQILTRSQRNNN